MAQTGNHKGLQFGIFLAPFHRLGENPTLGLRRDMELRGTDRWHARIILGLLDECDSVKWAHYAPDANRAQRALTMAYEIVELVNTDVAPTPGATSVGAKTA